MDRALLKSKFRELGTTETLAIDDVWKVESEKIRSVLVFHLCNEPSMFDVFKQLVGFGALVRSHNWVDHEPYQKQRVEIILSDIKRFFERDPINYSLSMDDHAAIVQRMKVLIESAVNELFHDDIISVDTFLLEGHEMSMSPVSTVINPQQHEQVLGLLEEGIKCSMFNRFPNLASFAVKNARRSGNSTPLI